MLRLFRIAVIAFLAALAIGCAGAGQTTGTFVDDSSITTKVKTKLYQDKTTSGWDISVKTVNGVVQLSGFVKSASEKARAGQIAAGVPGVKSVSNDLIVK